MKYQVTTERTNLNVRMAPRQTAGIMRVLERGSIIEVLPVPPRNGWCQLESGGWVATEFLSPVDRRATVPREISVTNQLPPFESLWQNYPPGEPEAVKKEIGGKVNAKWIENTCVIRLSHAFNYSGHAIPSDFPGLSTVSGGDGMRYAFRVKEMRKYLEATFGPAKLQASGPEAFIPAQNKRGIIMFDVAEWNNATGHFDMWNGKEARHDAYFSKAREVLMWW